MSTFHPKRIWFWIALAAIAIAMVALLLPHTGNAADHQAWVALFPMFVVGLIAPFSQKFLLNVGHACEEPALVPSFQRPPPASIR
jgi:hypothetical protein